MKTKMPPQPFQRVDSFKLQNQTYDMEIQNSQSNPKSMFKNALEPLKINSELSEEKKHLVK
jgi:hypothetical protein